MFATGSIAKFSMVRLSATTHAMNTDQRFLPVAFTDHGDGSYTLELESNPNVLLPGYYWIFAVDTAGVPSVGRTFQVLRDDGSPDPGLEVEAESAVLSGSFAVGIDAGGAQRPLHLGAERQLVTSRPDQPQPRRARVRRRRRRASTGSMRAVLAPSRRENSFWITVDGAARERLPLGSAGGRAYQTDSVSDRDGADPVLVTLAAGDHTVEVIHREAGRGSTG